MSAPFMPDALPASAPLPAFAERTPTPCPVAPLARQLGAAVTALTKRRARAEPEVEQMLGARVCAMEEAISFQPSASLPGALCQVEIAASFLQEVLQEADLDDASRRDLRAALRLLYGARAGLVEGAEAAEAHAERAAYYMPRRADPFRPVRGRA